MRCTSLLLAATLVALAGCTTPPERPQVAALPATEHGATAAPRDAVVDRAFGLELPDPYRWMEGEDNARFDAWFRAQVAASRARLDALPTLAAWNARLEKLATATTTHDMLRLVGDRLFFLRVQGASLPVLAVREADGSERVLVDPATLGDSALILGYSVAPDGSKLAVNLGFHGNEIGQIAFFDSRSGARLPDTLEPVWSEFPAHWLPDGSGVLYTRMRATSADDADPLQGMSARLHRFGTPGTSDHVLARAGANDALAIAANDFPSFRVTPGSDWVLLAISGARASLRLCVARLPEVLAAQPAWRCVVDDADAIQGTAQHGDTLYLLSAKGAPNRRVLSLDLRDPTQTIGDAQVAVPERPDAVLTGFSVGADGLYLRSMWRGMDRIERYAWSDGALAAIDLPYPGASHMLQADPRQPGVLLSLESWTEQRRMYRYDGQALVDLELGMRGAPSYPEIEAEQLTASSADGTQVPLTVIHRRDLALDGHARALMAGYGGYGISIQPTFSPFHLEWVKQGNVRATCHIRGGGELGDAWRQAGAGANKQRGVEDFIACAGELARRGYSTPARTAGNGTSMGGVLAGGAYTTAPASWGAMVISVGLLNPVRLLAAKNGANQIAELGDPRTAEGLRQLRAMDPYQHVRDGEHYPPLLLVTGMADQRVAPWNSGKFGASVRHASPTTPVWYRSDEESGHFISNLSAAAREFADVYGFLEAMLGPD